MPPRARKPAARAPKAARAMVEVRNPNHPAYRGRLDREKVEAMRAVLLRILPKGPPGLTQAEMAARAEAEAPAELFAGKTMWWAKSVQLDLEARGLVVRDAGRPLRWRRA